LTAWIFAGIARGLFAFFLLLIFGCSWLIVVFLLLFEGLACFLRLWIFFLVAFVGRLLCLLRLLRICLDFFSFFSFDLFVLLVILIAIFLYFQVEGHFILLDIILSLRYRLHLPYLNLTVTFQLPINLRQ
jgi:hypothetical protein